MNEAGAVQSTILLTRDRLAGRGGSGTRRVGLHQRFGFRAIERDPAGYRGERLRPTCCGKKKHGKGGADSQGRLHHKFPIQSTTLVIEHRSLRGVPLYYCELSSRFRLNRKVDIRLFNMIKENRLSGDPPVKNAAAGSCGSIADRFQHTTDP